MSGSHLIGGVVLVVIGLIAALIGQSYASAGAFGAEQEYMLIGIPLVIIGILLFAFGIRDILKNR